jgi:DNA-binding transcriptional MerR regulator
MESDRLTLTELSDRSNVTPRTVHFYIQQGLLPPAGSPGPGAKYDEGHLARLRLIRRLQREHLPLAEIRKRLEAMDDEAIRTAAAESTADQHPEPASALDYVRRLLALDHRGQATRLDRIALNTVTPAARPATRVAAAESAPALSLGALASPIEALPPGPAAQAPATRPSVAERSQWERYSLAPDIELHVRRPLSRDQNRRVERLLARAHDVFNEDLP